MTQQMLISTEDTVLVFIDCQDELLSGLASIDVRTLTDSWIALAKSAVERRVPVVTTVMELSDFEVDGHSHPRVVFPDTEAIARVALNPWEDKPFAQAVAAKARQRLVLAGVYTEGAITFAALSALREGYDTYVVRDGCVGKTVADHETAVARMIQAGVVPVTHRQLLLEWGRNDRPSGKGRSKWC